MAVENYVLDNLTLETLIDSIVDKAYWNDGADLNNTEDLLNFLSNNDDLKVTVSTDKRIDLTSIVVSKGDWK